MKKYNIWRISILGPILFGIMYFILYLIKHEIPVVVSTTFFDFPEGRPMFNHELPFTVSSLWNIPASYFYFLAFFAILKNEIKDGLQIILIIFLLVSLFFSFGFHFILGLAFAILSSFFISVVADNIRITIIASLFICFVTVIFLGLVIGFGPGLTVGMILGIILMVAVTLVSSMLYFDYIFIKYLLKKYLLGYLFAKIKISP